MRVFTADDYNKMRLAYAGSHLISPLLIDWCLHRLIFYAERRIRAFRLGDQIAPKVIIVVIVKADEYTLGSHRHLRFSLILPYC